MSVSNRITLAQLDKMDAAAVSALPIDQIAMLLEDVSELQARAKRLDGKLFAAMDLGFSARAAAARRAAGKDTGTVRTDVDGFTVIADLPKNVKWDQAKLKAAMETVAAWGEKPGEYVDIKLSVSESKFNAWPSTIKAVFEPARTVGTGKPSYSIETSKAEAA